MNNRDAADAYKTSAIETAPPIKIIRMLYQGAIRFLDQAAAEDPSSSSTRFHEFVLKADAIASELRLAINHEPNPELGENLERLYLFVEERLGTAMLKREAAPLAEARQILVTLLDAWNHVDADATRVA